MSTHATPSPRRGPCPAVESPPLPGGQCRYILLNPEIKGQRCACVSFTLNKALPSASCDCGHFACYHLESAESSPDNQELENLKQRLLEIERDRDGLKQQVEVLQERLVQRIGNLEGVVEKSKEEATQEIKTWFSNLNRAWKSIGDLERLAKLYERHFGRIDAQLQVTDAELQRLGMRQLELVDNDIALELRVEWLEDERSAASSVGGPHERSTADDPTEPEPESVETSVVRGRPESTARRPGPGPGPGPGPSPASLPLHPRPPPSTDGVWTVHVSLLPTKLRPFPFERDTNAYKRCLSRGLHQMVPISGPSADSFVSAVSRAFGHLLRGRLWVPLQAQPCTAEQLAGLPMLRQLDPALLHGRYDADFLRKHCAVCDGNGKIDSLYIAMRDDSFSWHFLRRAPIWLDGLEDSWRDDDLLDKNDPFDDDAADEATRPSAGDLLTLPSLKRAASEMSRSSSFGSATTATIAEGEGSRPKLPRIYPTVPNTIEVRRGVRTS